MSTAHMSVLLKVHANSGNTDAVDRTATNMHLFKIYTNVHRNLSILAVYRVYSSRDMHAFSNEQATVSVIKSYLERKTRRKNNFF